MIRRTLAAAALAATTLITTNVIINYAGDLQPDSIAAGTRSLSAGQDVDDDPAFEPPPGLSSSQRPPSDPLVAIRIPSLGDLPPVLAAPSRRERSDAGAPAATTRSVLPSGLSSLFNGDFDTGDFSQWTTCQSVFTNSSCSGYESEHYSMEIVPGRRDGFAAKFIVRPGDVPDFGGGERSEVSGHGDEAATREGDERWYQFSMRFDEDFPEPADGSWFIVMQWHSGSGSPPLALNISPDLTVDIGGDGVDFPERSIGPVRRGEWVDYTLHVGFSQDSDSGFVEAWENGVQTVERYNRATMSSDENYLKMGIYRGNDDDSTAAVTIDEFRVSG